MSILKLKPSCKDYLWGGRRLIEEYNKEYDGEILAETWELSCHPDGPSVIANGPYRGKTLQQYIDAEGKDALGSNCRRFRDFPILIKFIDARDNLSIQVHPDNRYALKNEGQYGKTEMWYVMDAGKDAFLYYGFQKEISKEEFARRIQDDALLETLHAVPVKKGDVLFIQSGTLHAIGKGILIAEIQQNSNITYRVYDYGRVGADGKKRDLHIEKALAVTKRAPVAKTPDSYPHIADCDYFTVDKLNLDGRVMKRMEGSVDGRSFASLLILDGKGTIESQGETLSFQKGDSFFLPAGMGAYQIAGACDALVTTIREKSAPVRIGIHMGSDVARIGLVDAHQKLIAYKEMPTNAALPEQETIAAICREALALLGKEGIPLDQCIGIGIGAPGTIDRQKGVVLYSNNIRWEDVPLASEMEKHFPLPIQIANDADCAALGETVAGAGKDYADAIMLTLGAGVGSGIVLNGEIYHGKGPGCSEIGHMVIAENGAPCTCGRRGCLEAYASTTALQKNAFRAVQKELSPQEIFRGAKNGDERLLQVTQDYVRWLGVGIVNVINIFRPQLIILGGELSFLEELPLDLIRAIISENCFGKNRGELPEIEIAALGGQAGVIGAANLF